MVYLTSKLNGNALHLDQNTGELMETYCAGGALYTPGNYVQWDELDEETFEYYEDRHHYLLKETMPQFVADFYPFGV
jgi:membrane-bound inhibitor of C-type lysozyme